MARMILTFFVMWAFVGAGIVMFRAMSVHDIDIDAKFGVSAYGWDGMCIPYGGDGNTRTSDYLKEAK